MNSSDYGAATRHREDDGEHISSIDDFEDELIECDGEKNSSYSSSDVMGLLKQI